MNSENGAASTREQALATLRDQHKFLLTTHERPDGDAVGSLAAMQQVLAALGKDAVAFLTPDEFPLPYEYRFIELRGLVTQPPDDVPDRVLVFLDCGNVDRTPAAALAGQA
nr:bifunctional oligoribonuclease/PAP phosphatase NrnA [Actinomycetota bacterium]